MFRDVVRADGIRGRGWLAWFGLSHGVVVASVLGQLNVRTTVDHVVEAGLTVVALGASVWFWRRWLRTWRRVERAGSQD